jgi:hypothetical protein
MPIFSWTLVPLFLIGPTVVIVAQILFIQRLPGNKKIKIFASLIAAAINSYLIITATAFKLLGAPIIAGYIVAIALVPMFLFLLKVASRLFQRKQAKRDRAIQSRFASIGPAIVGVFVAGTLCLPLFYPHLNAEWPCVPKVGVCDCHLKVQPQNIGCP